MCGRYSFVNTFNFQGLGIDIQGLEFRSNFNVSPGHIMPVITNNTGLTIDFMRWGFVPTWSKDPRIGFKMINARSETVFEKPSWKTAIKQKRCAIPAYGFYEWKKIDSKTKQPYMIRLQTPDMLMGGVYSIWQDAEKQLHPTFAVLTTTANHQMHDIHDRCPVFIQPSLLDEWLNPTLEEIEINSFLQPETENVLDIYPVSTDVGSVKNNYEQLLDPIRVLEN